MSIFSELGVREGEDRVKEEVLYNLAACYFLAERRIEEALVPFGLSSVKMNALMLVKHVGRNAGILPTELAKKMIVSAGNVTRLMDRLERENLIQRISRTSDRRVKAIVITPKGSKLLDRAWPVHKAQVSRIVSLMRGTDVRILKKLLNGFREHLTLSLKEDLS